LFVLALAIALLAPGAAEPQGPPVTIDPAMARGAPNAPVTIVEFSDYQ
jgi:protein-disulfide isomerase